jgi:uncharacterized membrane protein
VGFAFPLPWWALTGVAAVAVAIAWLAYRRSALTPVRRGTLTVLRLLTLLLLVLFLMRPTVSSSGQARNAIVPILVDTSRSMSIQDADGDRRIDRARALVRDSLLPAIGPAFQTEVLAFGDAVTAAAPDALTAAARRSDVAGALAAVRERYRGRVIAGIVIVSDGGDTSGAGERALEGVPPLFPVAVGSADVGRDREVLSVTAAEAVLDESRVDLAVSAVSHGERSGAIELRLLENGRPIEVRRAMPAADGAPVREVFQVAPAPGAPVVYTVEIPPASGELVPENNARSVLVQPPARPRRVLLVEGAPGFEHSFLKRALAVDRGLEVDSVVRKGKNEQGNDTFYIQAARSRSDALAAGYPRKTEELFAYDVLVLANVEGAQLSRTQLESTRDFVGRRGGGILVLGAHSFLRRGLLDTAIEEVLPLDLADRGRGTLQAPESRGLNRLSLTTAGEAHPVMQLATALEETRRRWERAPALASVAPLGGPRPGATVLASTTGPGGTRALVAVQRYGDGRSMIFTGEAAWRWRMLLPATDRSYDTFWRQAIRWLALPASDPVSIASPAGASPGDLVPLRVAARDGAFEPLRDAAVDVRVTAPDGRIEQLRAALESGGDHDGRFLAHYRPEQPGVYRVAAEARRDSAPAGSGATAFLVGGADLEMADPRVDVPLLRRLAVASGGRVVDPQAVGSILDDLRASAPVAALAVRRDLWHNGWSFAAIVALLAAEWILRRRWGLR